MSATYAPDMPGPKMDLIYVLPGVSTARATEWFTLGQKLVSAIPTALRIALRVCFSTIPPIGGIGQPRSYAHGHTSVALPHTCRSRPVSATRDAQF